MARDMAKKYAADYRWAKENTYRISLTILKNSDTSRAIEKVQKDGHVRATYAMTALREKLIRDGYLQPEDQQES